MDSLASRRAVYSLNPAVALAALEDRRVLILFLLFTALAVLAVLYMAFARGTIKYRAYLMEPVTGFLWNGFHPPADDARGRLALEELARRIRLLLDSGQAVIELQDVIHFRHGISRQVLTIVLHQIHSYLEV